MGHDFIGFGALNWDLIYEFPDLQRLEELNISLYLGEEITLDRSILHPLLNMLQRYGKKKGESGGGQAANTAYALARMGFRTALIGKVGTDKWGDLILEGLDRVDTTLIKRGGNSGICISLLTLKSERSMMIFPNANNFQNGDTLSTYLPCLADAKILHLTSFSDNASLYAQEELIDALDKGPLISLDPGDLYAKLGKDALKHILKSTYFLFATEGELATMTGLSLNGAVESMFDLGVSMVICKQGAKGATLFLAAQDKKGVTTLVFPPELVEVKDSTGAGDCFAAGFLAGVLRGYDPETCGILGSRAAALGIQGYGRETYPDRGVFDNIK